MPPFLILTKWYGFMVWGCQNCPYVSTEPVPVHIFLVLDMFAPLTALAVLVTAVPAVVSSVTHPSFWNAAVVPTLKLSGWAEFIWGFNKECVKQKIKASKQSHRLLHLSLFRFECVNLPQWASSAPFSQSFSLSQVQLTGIQRPLGQAKKGVGHLALPLPDTVKCDKQMFNPAQTQKLESGFVWQRW